MTSRWNLWVGLDCIGVVSGCCCKEVCRYPHNNYYFSIYTYSPCIIFSSFFGRSIPFLFNFKMFFILVCIVYIVYYVFYKHEKTLKKLTKK